MLIWHSKAFSQPLLFGGVMAMILAAEPSFSSLPMLQSEHCFGAFQVGWGGACPHKNGGKYASSKIPPFWGKCWLSSNGVHSWVCLVSELLWLSLVYVRRVYRF